MYRLEEDNLADKAVRNVVIMAVMILDLLLSGILSPRLIFLHFGLSLLHRD